MLQYVAVCRSVLQCVAVCCSVLQCVAVCCAAWFGALNMCSEVCGSVLQRVAPIEQRVLHLIAHNRYTGIHHRNQMLEIKVAG